MTVGSVVSGTVLLEAVADVARLAGDIALGHFRPGIAVDSKSDGSPVTIADRASEKAAREWIERRFPDDGILGEEQGETRGGSTRRWIVDPIDGTKSFVRGVPLWGTLVAVAEGPTVLAGAAYFPAVGELVTAAPGQGCWWNGASSRVSDVASLSSATVLTTDERFPKNDSRREGWRNLAARASMSRTWGDCFGYLLVATGRAEAMVDAVANPWDLAALLPIVREAGGVFTDWSGAATAFSGSAIATNGSLARVVRETLGAGASDA